MIVNCRVSNDSPCVVFWRSKEKVRVGRRYVTEEVENVREFSSFADGNGFALGLQKRGVLVMEIKILS